MKFSWGAIQFSIFLLVCIGVERKIVKMYSVPLSKKISLHIDKRFSKKMLERLNSFVKEHEKLSLTPSYFTAILQEAFPVINSIRLKSHMYEGVQVSIKGARPLALINKDLVLATNNTLVERDTFIEEDIKDLPLFYLSQSEKDKEKLNISHKCVSFIRSFDRSLLKKYDVQWVENTLILLRDQKYPEVTMLVDNKTKLSSKLTLAYEQARDKTLQKQTKSKGRDWFVDMRFRNQVIVFEKGAKG